jgi:23S rRNA (pseudouridine1915-N3)-methyltransferase
MELVLVAVGKLRAGYREMCDEYLRRLRHYARVREVEIKEAGRPSGTVQRRREADRLRERLPEAGIVVALDIGGTQLSSEGVAEKLRRWEGKERVVALVLGGSTGLAEDFRQAASFRWSLGPLTLPHELARVVVAEQLYRGFTILKGGPYHKGER